MQLYEKLIVKSDFQNPFDLTKSTSVQLNKSKMNSISVYTWVYFYIGNTQINEDRKTNKKKNNTRAIKKIK